MTRALMVAALAALVSSGCAANGDLYTDLDTDYDGQLSEMEFTAGVDDFGVFDDWDANRDAYLDEDEFGVGMNEYGIDYDLQHGYEAWDLNDDRMLDENEFYGGTFDELDSDDDGFVDEAEFGLGIQIGV